MNMDEILIDEESTVIQVMERLDITSKRVLFVVDEGILVAAITDGDIRRWILSKGSLNAKVKEFANYNPKYIYENNSSLADYYMKKYLVGALPIVDKSNRIISIAYLSEKNLQTPPNINLPVVIMAGGLGTRLYPFTKILPKPLIPVGNIPIAEHIINRFRNYGCKDFYLIVNHKKNMIKAYFNEIGKDYEITYIDEDKPLGTGGGLSLLKGKVKTTFILSNCDILIDDDYEKILEFHKNTKNLITMVCSLKKYTIPYGIVDVGENGRVEGLREKPEMTYLTNTGCYIVEPQVIEELESDAYTGFPDIIEHYRSTGSRISAYPISEKSWLDMGQLEGMEEMRNRLSCDEMEI